MAKDHRIVRASHPVNYTCRNGRFSTDTARGYPHLPGEAAGSVLPVRLTNSASLGYDLWLEHVAEEGTSQAWYWFMWYDPSGVPTIPMSAVFQKAELQQLLASLAEFVP